MATNSAAALEVPQDCDRVPVRIESDPPASGVALIKTWTNAERRKRAGKRFGKIIGTILAVSCLALFVHLLIPFVLCTWAVVLLVGAPFYLRLLNERESWYRIEVKCPHCGNEGLRPFIDTNFHRDQGMTAQCPACGQNMRFSAVS